jgi:pyrimidine-nucleoside phosphorylase
MQDLDQARELARTMVGIGQEAGRSVVAVISSMDQPLGNSIGNTLEVAEAIRVLKGDASPDLWQVCLALGQEMLLLAGRAKTEAEAGQALQKARDSGAALARLADFLKGQGADPALAKEPGLLPQPTWTKTFSAPQGGYLTRIDTAGLGHLFVALGGGRRKKDDPIDYTAGFTLLARLGQQVKAGAPLVRVQANDQAKLDQVMARLPDIFSFAKSPDPVRPVILQIIRPDDISAGML